MLIAEIVLVGVAVYAAMGVLFGIAFLTCGLTRVDPIAIQSSVAFRLMILPGTAILWPAMLHQWRRSRR